MPLICQNGQSLKQCHWAGEVGMWLWVCRSFSFLNRWIMIAPNLSRRREEATETGRKLCSRSSASLFYHTSLHLLGPYFLLSTTHTFTPSRSSCSSSICTLFSLFCVQELNTWYSSGCFWHFYFVPRALCAHFHTLLEKQRWRHSLFSRFVSSPTVDFFSLTYFMNWKAALIHTFSFAHS